VTSAPLEADDALEAMGRAMPDFERRLEEKQIHVFPHDEWYLPDGEFDRDQAVARCVPFLGDALARGHEGLRATGNLFWVKNDLWREFTDYECMLDHVIVDHPLLVVCTYSLEQCVAAQMIDVLRNHRFALIKHDDWTLIEPSENKKATAAVERMNTALAERTADLQAALDDLGGFCRWVSHDLRTPLRAISSFGDLLAQRCETRLDGREQHMLQRIRDNSTRMDQLITDILAYSSAQESAMLTQPLDMELLVRRVCEPLTDTVGVRRVEVRVDPLPAAQGDPAMISQVLANLLGNAVKFTRDRPVARIEVGSVDRGDDIAYYVRDNGLGFEQSEADRLFSAFKRLHSADEYEGTGLGLAIVRQIVTRHGGRVWAEGEPGGGATFYFSLPDQAGAGATG
jgi:signal transduction histidine kinase